MKKTTPSRLLAYSSMLVAGISYLRADWVADADGNLTLDDASSSLIPISQIRDASITENGVWTPELDDFDYRTILLENLSTDAAALSIAGKIDTELYSDYNALYSRGYYDAALTSFTFAATGDVAIDVHGRELVGINSRGILSIPLWAGNMRLSAEDGYRTNVTGIYADDVDITDFTGNLTVETSAFTNGYIPNAGISQEVRLNEHSLEEGATEEAGVKIANLSGSIQVNSTYTAEREFLRGIKSDDGSVEHGADWIPGSETRQAVLLGDMVDVADLSGTVASTVVMEDAVDYLDPELIRDSMSAAIAADDVHIGSLSGTVSASTDIGAVSMGELLDLGLDVHAEDNYLPGADIHINAEVAAISTEMDFEVYATGVAEDEDPEYRTVAIDSMTESGSLSSSLTVGAQNAGAGTVIENLSVFGVSAQEITMGDVAGSISSNMSVGDIVSEDPYNPNYLRASSTNLLGLQQLEVGDVSGTISNTMTLGDMDVGIAYNPNGIYNGAPRYVEATNMASAGDVIVGEISGSVSSDITLGHYTAENADYSQYVENQNISTRGSVQVDGVSGSLDASTTVEIPTTGNLIVNNYNVHQEGVPVTDPETDELLEAPTLDLGNVSGDIESSIALTQSGEGFTSGTVELTNNAIYASDSYTSIGDVSGAISSSIETSDLRMESDLYHGSHSINSYAVKSFSNYYSVEDLNSITIGNVSGSIDSSVDMGEVSVTNQLPFSVYSYGIKSVNNLTLGNVEGQISSSADIEGLNRAVSDSVVSSDWFYQQSTAIEAYEDLTIGDVSGSILSDAILAGGEFSAENVLNSINRTISSTAVDGGTITLGNVSGTIASTAQLGDSSISGDSSYEEEISANVHATAVRGEQVNLAGLSGLVSSTASIGNHETSNLHDLNADATAYGIYSYDGVSIDSPMTGSVVASASLAGGSLDGSYSFDPNLTANAIRAGVLDLNGMSADAEISAKTTLGDLTQTNVEADDTDNDIDLSAQAIVAADMTFGDIAGSVVAQNTIGSGILNPGVTSTTTAISQTGSSGMKKSKGPVMTSGQVTIGDLSGTVEATVDMSDLDTVRSVRNEASAIALGSSTYSDETKSEHSIGAISGNVTVDSNTDVASEFYIKSQLGGVIAESAAVSVYRDDSVPSTKIDSDEPVVLGGMDLHIGTLSGAVSVTSQSGDAGSLEELYNYGVSGFSEADGYAHDLLIDTLSGTVSVSSSTDVNHWSYEGYDIAEVESMKSSYDEMLLNVNYGITDHVDESFLDTNGNITEYDGSADASTIHIGDFSGNVVVNADLMAYDMSGLLEELPEESNQSLLITKGEETLPVTVGDLDKDMDLHMVFNSIAGINAVDSDVLIDSMSGAITVTANPQVEEEGVYLQNGTVLVSGIRAEDNSVEITDFSGNISVTADLDGEGKVVATGIHADEIAGTYSGSISVTSPDIAVGMLIDQAPLEVNPVEKGNEIVANVAEEPETPEEPEAPSVLTIDGSIAAVGAEGETYSIYAGYVDFDDEAEDMSESATLYAGSEDDVIQVTGNASFEGAIDLTGGDDKISLVGDNASTDENSFSAVVANVETLEVNSGVWSLEGGEYDSSIVDINGGTLHVSSDLDADGLDLIEGTLVATAGNVSNLEVAAGTVVLQDTGALAESTLNGGILDIQRAYDLTSDVLDAQSGSIEFNNDGTLGLGIDLGEGVSLDFNGSLLKAVADIDLTGSEINWNSGDVDLNGYTVTVPEFAVPTGSTLYGTGSIAGSLSNSGVLSPGYSPGSIAVSGDFVQTTDGLLLMEIDGEAHDLLQVGGTATLAGTLQLEGDMINNYEYTLITAEGGMTGTFDATTGTAMSRAELFYNTNDLMAVIVHVPYPEFADNFPQHGVAASLESIFQAESASGLLADLMDEMDSMETEGEVYHQLAALSAPMMMNTDWQFTQNNTIVDTLTSVPNVSAEGKHFWAKGLYGDSDYDTVNNYGSRDGDYKGAMVGCTQGFDNGWGWGIAFALLDSDLYDAHGGHYNNDSRSIWLNGAYDVDGGDDAWSYGVHFGAGYGDSDVNTQDRPLVDGSRIEADFDASMWSAYVDLVMSRDFGNWTVAPSVGITWQSIDNDSHTDYLNGESLRLWDSFETDSALGHAGVRVAYTTMLGDVEVQPFAYGYCEYQFNDGDQARFVWADTLDSVWMSSAEWNDESYRLGGGVNFLFTENLSADITSDFSFGDVRDAFGVRAGVSYGF